LTGRDDKIEAPLRKPKLPSFQTLENEVAEGLLGILLPILPKEFLESKYSLVEKVSVYLRYRHGLSSLIYVLLPINYG
jgi:hypothetical protein